MTREIIVGNVKIGGNNPVAIQSMCTTKTGDINATISQIKELEKAGCEIVRVAVPDMKSAKGLKEIKKSISLPLVADIHFDYRLAIESAKHADKLRINPGNIGNESLIKKVVDAARENEIPIRIGVNLGSLEKESESRYGRTPKAMVDSARKNIEMLEKNRFFDIVVSLKASDIKTTVEANRLFSKNFDYPVHIGITESGTQYSGAIKSSIGLGMLLYEGIGDTMRVSLSGNPVNEISAAIQIQKHLGLRKILRVASCPTCGRTNFDVAKYAELIEKRFGRMQTEKKVAVMGCAVNGPGEAKDADIALIGNNGNDYLLYINGKLAKKVKEEDILKEVEEELKK